MAQVIADPVVTLRSVEAPIYVEQVKPEPVDRRRATSTPLGGRKRRGHSRNVYAISISLIALSLLLLTLKGAIVAKRTKGVARVSDGKKAPTEAPPKGPPDEKKKEKRKEAPPPPEDKKEEKTQTVKEKKIEKVSAEEIDLLYDFPNIKDDKVKAQLKEVLKAIHECTKPHEGYLERRFEIMDQNAAIVFQVLESKRRAYWPFVGPAKNVAKQLEADYRLVSKRTNGEKVAALKAFTIGDLMEGANGYVSFGIEATWKPTYDEVPAE